MRDTSKNSQNGASPSWDEAEEALAAKLWQAGKSGGQIAKKLGRTRGQVLGKLARLKLLGDRCERPWGAVSETEVRRRLKLAKECVRDGECLASAAKIIGLHPSAFTKFLHKHGRADLAADLAANGAAVGWQKRRAA
jgi:hypothetical protein